MRQGTFRSRYETILEDQSIRRACGRLQFRSGGQPWVRAGGYEGVFAGRAARRREVTMRAVFPAAVAIILSICLPVRAETATDAFNKLKAGDYGAAHSIAAPLAKAGDPAAQHVMGFLHENGLGVPRDMTLAITLYSKAANAGYADAQFSLGEIAYFAKSARQDPATAAAWYEKAAAQGHSRAQSRLGFLYANGLGVARDDARAASLFRDSADSGDPEGQFNLAIAYLNGRGVQRDLAKAAKWFEHAADAGHIDAQYHLALIYDAGATGKRDADKALRWMVAAAEGGSADAMVAMGLLVHDGRVKAKGMVAADWFERAAKAGDPQGQFLYAVALSHGDGRNRSVDEALLWVNAALANSQNIADDLLSNAQALQRELSAVASGRPALRN